MSEGIRNSKRIGLCRQSERIHPGERVHPHKRIYSEKRILQGKRVQTRLFQSGCLCCLSFCSSDLAQGVPDLDLPVDIRYIAREIFICLPELGMRARRIRSSLTRPQRKRCHRIPVDRTKLRIPAEPLETPVFASGLSLRIAVILRLVIIMYPLQFAFLEGSREHF